jgi:hypothetical protein
MLDSKVVGSATTAGSSEEATNNLFMCGTSPWNSFY